MAYLYFDESIREKGEFIIGALIVSGDDLSKAVYAQWVDMGLDPKVDEYKSSAIKIHNDNSVKQRSIIKGLLMYSKLALVVIPIAERKKLGDYCADLVMQLIDTEMLCDRKNDLFVDENILMSREKLDKLTQRNVSCVLDANSKIEAGIQVSDHAAHALGSMLLEELGILKKQIKASENSGYHPDEEFELGFELWADLRYALYGKQTYIDGLSPPPDDPANPFYQVDGYGLYIAKSCSISLTESAKERFGINYLGCIH
jgi:hypothetical protein